jgi:hypothetical protein
MGQLDLLLILISQTQHPQPASQPGDIGHWVQAVLTLPLMMSAHSVGLLKSVTNSISQQAAEKPFKRYACNQGWKDQAFTEGTTNYS